MISNSMLATVWRRLMIATFLWIAFWPILWFFRNGELTGTKAWFWIVGEMHYPFAAAVFLLSDGLLVRIGLKPWFVFFGSVFAVVLCMCVFVQFLQY